MEGQFGHAEVVSGISGWTLLFAKEPEPDLDLELDESGTARNQPSSFGSPAPQKPRLRMLILILLILVVAGGAYIAMDPETVMKLIGQEPPTAASSTPRATAVRPAIVPRSSSPIPTDRTPSVAAPGVIPTPLFREGQQVSAVTRPDAPQTASTLSQDAAETIPGSIVRPAETLLVLDAEMHNNRWVYSVRTDAGANGWIPETQLTAKP